MKQHPLHRIAQAAVQRSQPAAWALLALGFAAFLLLPLGAQHCYLDEKALLVGGSVPTIRRAGPWSGCVVRAGWEPPAAAGLAAPAQLLRMALSC